MTRRLWLAAVMMGASGVTHAAELHLPPGEDRAAWNDAIVVSGLERIPGSVRLIPGAQWRLVATRPDGSTVTQEIVAPVHAEAREAAAILAASLLRPTTLTALPLPPAPTPPPKATPKAAPQPRPAPAPPPPPPPSPEPEPAPVDAAPATIGDAQRRILSPRISAGTALTASATARSTVDQDVGLGLTFVASLYTPYRLHFELGASRIWTPRTDPASPDRSLTATNGWLSTGWETRPGLPIPTVTLGGSSRQYSLDDLSVARVWVPIGAVGAHWHPVPLDQPNGGLRLGFRLERDLRATILASRDGAEGAIAPWALVLNVGGRLGPTGQTWDTRPVDASRPEKKSSSL